MTDRSLNNGYGRKILTFAAVLVFFAASLAIFIRFSPMAQGERITPDGASAPTSTQDVGASLSVPGEPVRLVIPAIGVDAKIQKTGLTPAGDMGIPTNFTDTAWYSGGPRPGMPGSAVIDGHLDGKTVLRAVFYDLGKLVPGDIVTVIDADGKELKFQVIQSKVYAEDAAAPEVFLQDSGKTMLNLITCSGSWNKADKMYNERVVVFTELIK
jgi:hypothetical protein